MQDKMYGSFPDSILESRKEKLVTSVLGRFDSLKSMRSNYEPVWDEITDYVLPSRGSYSDLRSNVPAQIRNKDVLDSTGIVSCRALAARVVTELTSPGELWFEYRMDDPVLDADEAVRRFLYTISEKAYSFLCGDWRLPHIEVTTDWVAYGTACLFVNRVKENKNEKEELVFKAIPVTELYIAENFKGKPDTVFRHFQLPLRQIAQEFTTNEFTRDLMQCLEKDPDALYEVVHGVFPSEDYMPGAKQKDRMKFKSCYILRDKQILLSEGGFNEMPFIVFRFWKRTGEPYGGSPAWDALSEIRMINVMSKTAIRSFQLEAFPPLIAASDGVILPLKTMPNGVNIGGMSPDGRRLIEPLLTGGKTQLAFEVLEQRRQAIRNAFFVDPLINRENSIRTAAEVQKRASEELNGIAPFINRYEEEYLEKLLDRVLYFVLDNLSEEEKKNIPEAIKDRTTRIEYTGPLAKTHRAKQLESTSIFLQLVQTVAQSDPSILTVIKPENLIGMMTDLLGVPYAILKSRDEINAEKDIKDKQQMVNMLLQAGPAFGQTAKSTASSMKDVAQAAQIGMQGLGTP